MSLQLNVRTSETLINELDRLVKHGLFRNRTEAVNEGIRILIRRYKAMKIGEKIDTIAKKHHGIKNLTDTLNELRDEDDT